jgi:hypothetical protein
MLESPKTEQNDFERIGEEKQPSLVGEFVSFIWENKAWWMIPILLVFGLIGILVLLSSTGAAPFIYTLF